MWSEKEVNPFLVSLKLCTAPSKVTLKLGHLARGVGVAVLFVKSDLVSSCRKSVVKSLRKSKKDKKIYIYKFYQFKT